MRFRPRKTSLLVTMAIAIAVSTAGSAAARGWHGVSSDLVGLYPHGFPAGAEILPSGSVAFAGGHVQVDAPSAATDGVCVTGYVCLWQDANYLGIRVMTNVCDFTGDGLCDWQNLAPFGFNDLMSSWKNRMTVDAKWSFNAGGGGTQRCMNSGSQNPQLSGSNNDEASAVKVFTSSTAC